MSRHRLVYAFSHKSQKIAWKFGNIEICVYICTQNFYDL